MPRFIVDFKLPSFDKRGYKALLKTHMKGVIEDSVRVWLNATVVSLIPVWSGASAATFLHLARAVSLHLNTSPTSTSFFKNGRQYGESRSGPSSPINYGQGNQWSFEYSTTLKHLIFNESNNANVTHDPAVFSRLIKPGPYDFQSQGAAAFQQFAATVRLPDPTKSIRTKTLKVS